MVEDLSLLVRESDLPVEEFGAVVSVLDELRSVPLEAPAPSGELAALLAEGAPPAAVTAARVVPRPRRRTGIAVVALLLGLSGGGAAAAAANVLPDPLQSVVADFSERFLPFGFPAPAAEDEEPGEESPEEAPFQPRPGERQTLAPRDGGTAPTGQPGVAPTRTVDDSPAPVVPGDDGRTPLPEEGPTGPPATAPSAPAEQAPTGGPQGAPTGGSPEAPAVPDEEVAETSGWVPVSPGGQPERDGAAQRDDGGPAGSTGQTALVG
jgi:hypothetical protein